MALIINIKADLHVHSVSSGHAYSSVDELARAAANKGLKLIALTDHGPNMPGGPHEYHFGNLNILPDVIYGVRVLKGIEANILDDGKLDVSENRLKNLDFAAAGLHERTGHHLKNTRDYTKATIAAMENPYVKMITHPVNSYYPLNLEKVVEAARKNGVILEINAGSYHPKKGSFRGNIDWSIKLCKLAKKYAVPISLNSDAHYRTEVGDITSLTKIVEKAGLEDRDVINTSIERVLNFVDKKDVNNKKIV